MEVSRSSIKKFFIVRETCLYISGNGTFLYSRKRKPWVTFQAQKIQKMHSLEKFFIFQEKKLFCFYIKKLSQEKPFLIFQETKISHISGSKFPSLKKKKPYS